MAISQLAYSEGGEATHRSRTDKINEIVVKANGLLDPYLEEYYVPPQGLDVGGSNSPTRKLFKNNGVVGSDLAVKFAGTQGANIDVSGGYAALQNVINTPDAGGTGQFTIEFRIKPTRIHYEYVCSLGSNIGVRLDDVGGNPGYRIDMGSTRIFSAPLNINDWNYVCIVVDNTANRSLTVYTNGTKYVTDTGTGTSTMYTSLLEFGYGSDGTATAQYALSDFTIYDVMFTEAQALERWNNGVAIAALPTGVTDANRVLFMTLDDGAGTNVVNTKGPDMVLSGTEGVDFTWVSGAIGAGGSFGVYLPAYTQGLVQRAGATFPIPNTWERNTDIIPHIHFTTDVDIQAGDTITFGIEYSLSREGEVFGNTVTVYATYTAPGTIAAGSHKELYWAPVAIPGTADEAPHIITTIFRKGDDTYAGDVFMVGFGMKYSCIRTLAV